MLRSKVSSLGNPCDQSWRRKEGYGGKEIPKYMDVSAILSTKVIRWTPAASGAAGRANVRPWSSF